MVDELATAGVVAHLGDPAEIATLRGPKKRAKTDRAAARLLRTLLLEGRFPESWIPPAHVVEVRTLGRLYCTLMDERRAWQQRIHASCFTRAAHRFGRCCRWRAATRLRRPSCRRRDGIRGHRASPYRRADRTKWPGAWAVDRLRARQVACQALQARQYGVGWLCAAIMWAEIGDARRFSSSDQLVRFAGLDVTVYSSAGKRSPGASVPAGFPGAAVGDVRGG